MHSPEADHSNHPHTVLVVDDEQLICDLFQVALAMDGYSVRTARTAEDALEHMERAQAQVLFVDYNLPGMSGAALCREVSKLWPESILIAMTGDGALIDSANWKNQGFADCLPKPFSLGTLLTVVSRAFEHLTFNQPLPGELYGQLLTRQSAADRRISANCLPAEPQ